MRESALIIHNVLWSRYKGAVFTELNKLQERSSEISIDFIQIAEIERGRLNFSKVDVKYHSYPYTLIFEGAYENNSSLSIAYQIINVIRKKKYTCVVLPGYSHLEDWLLLAYLLLKNVRTYVFCDSTLMDRKQVWYKSIFKHIFFRLCGRALCYGVRARKLAINYGVPQDRAYMRCQAASLPNSYSKEKVIDMLNSRSGSYFQYKKTFLYVGRLSSEKNLLRLLSAFGAIRISHPEAMLEIVGSGPQREELEKLTISLGLNKSVRFFGAVDPEEIIEYYERAFALILPSLSEPWGLVVNEAMSFGCPCIVSKYCGSAPDLIVDGVTGFSFDPNSENDLIVAINEMIKSSDRRLAMGVECVEMISKYTPNAAASQIMNALLINS